jgi:hypothetical protein
VVQSVAGPSRWERLRSFLAWFFAPRLVPEAWRPSRIYGMGYAPADDEGKEARQALEESDHRKR